MTLLLAFLLALGSAILVGLAYLREHDAAASLPPLSLRTPVGALRLLLADRAWLVGFAMESVGWLLYVAALALAPLALVQSVSAGGIGVLAFASARRPGQQLTQRELVGASVAVIGLVALGASLTGGGGEGRAPILPVLAWLLASSLLAGLALAAERAAVLPRAVGAGVAAGLLFSVGDISTKLATSGGLRALFVVGLAAGYLAGTTVLQVGYQRGAALLTAGLATLLTNALPIVAGMTVLGEGLPQGAAGVLRLLSFPAVLIGGALLAKPPRAPSTVTTRR